MARKNDKGSVAFTGGGAAGEQGLAFQTDVAIFWALEDFPLASTLPANKRGPKITPERRLRVGHRAVEWDVERTTHQVRIEVKLRPTGDEIEDFLQRARDSGAAYTYQLTIGRSPQPATRLKELAQIARAAEPSEFQDQLSKQAATALQRLRPSLGQDPQALLRRIEVQCASPDFLARAIKARLQSWYGPKAADVLAMLRDEVRKAAGSRQPFYVGQLYRKVRLRFGGAEFSKHDYAAIGVSGGHVAILSHLCPGGLPPSVVTRVLGEQTAARLRELGHLELDDGLEVFLTDATPDADPSPVMDRLVRVLVDEEQYMVHRIMGPSLANALLDWATANKTGENAVLVARLFPRLDNVFKACGNKGLVEGLARASISACQYLASIDGLEPADVADLIARSRVCGLAWTAQRTGRLPLAREEIDRGLQAAHQVGLAATEALAVKCSGRLRRMEAADATPRHRRELLEQSADELKQAVTLIEGLSPRDFPPESRDEHAADARSLLARTRLEQGRTTEAFRLADRAFGCLQPDSKAWMDARLLMGDCHLADGNRESAIDCYRDVLDRGSAWKHEGSEANARARLALARVVSGQTQRSAVVDAVKAFNHLRDWTSMDTALEIWWPLVRKDLPSGARDVLDGEPPHTRWLALADHERRIASVEAAAHTAPQRSDPGPRYWRTRAETARLRAQNERGGL